MSTIKELREQQARILANARSKFDEIKADTPEDRSAEINREFDAMMVTSDGLQGQVDRMERLDALQRSINTADPRRPNAGAEGRGADDGAPVSYRDAFHAYLRAEGQVGAMEPEARAVLSQGYSKMEMRAQTTTTTAGGFTIPTEMATFITKSMLAWGPMYDPGICSEIVTASGVSILMPTINDTAVTIVKLVEGTAVADTGAKDVVFGQKTLDAFPFVTEWLRVSKELADDSVFAMEALLGDLLGERLGRRANLELTTGDGVGDPNGVVTAASSGKVAASTTAITADEIIDLIHSVDPAYRTGPKVALMFNDATLAAISKLKDGQGNYLLTEGNLSLGLPRSLRGYKYHINQAMAGLTGGVNSRVMVFGDLGKYYVRKVGSPMIGAMQDKDFWPGFGVAGYIRLDGELADTAAVKFLALAAV